MSQALQIVRDHYAASAAGDLSAMTAAFAPQIEWTEMAGFPYAGTYIGASAIVAGVFARIGADWTGFAAVPEKFVVEGADVVAFGTYSGTFTQSGRFLEAKFVHRWSVVDDQVVGFEQYTDTKLVAEAMLA